MARNFITQTISDLKEETGLINNHGRLWSHFHQRADLRDVKLKIYIIVKLFSVSNRQQIFMRHLVQQLKNA